VLADSVSGVVFCDRVSSDGRKDRVGKETRNPFNFLKNDFSNPTYEGQTFTR
jgi:hypothetical protein